MQLTLITREYFRFINLIRLFIITYKIFFYQTHVIINGSHNFNWS